MADTTVIRPVSAAEAMLTPLLFDISTMSPLKTLSVIAKSLYLRKVPQEKWEEKLTDAFNVRMGALDVRIRSLVQKISEMGIKDPEFNANLGGATAALRQAFPFIRDNLMAAKITADTQIPAIINESISQIRKNQRVAKALANAEGALFAMAANIKRSQRGF